jgi:hypothetical protein
MWKKKATIFVYRITRMENHSRFVWMGELITLFSTQVG